MAIFNVGMLISHLRQKRNMTQEKLAEGICARSTIARIEKGERKPDWYTFRNIMYRLGQEPENFYSSYADEDEMFVLQTYDRLSVLLKEFKFKEMKLELEGLQNNILFTPP